MSATAEAETVTPTLQSRFPWNEYRLLLYSAVIGIAGGLGSQVFVLLLNRRTAAPDRHCRISAA
jgi:hypothetical protein